MAGERYRRRKSSLNSAVENERQADCKSSPMPSLNSIASPQASPPKSYVPVIRRCSPRVKGTGNGSPVWSASKDEKAAASLDAARKLRLASVMGERITSSGNTC